MKLSWLVNGDVLLQLTPENDDDWKMLEIAFAQRVVKEIRKPVRDSENKESLTIMLSRESKPAPVGKTEQKAIETDPNSRGTE